MAGGALVSLGARVSFRSLGSHRARVARVAPFPPMAAGTGDGAIVTDNITNVVSAIVDAGTDIQKQVTMLRCRAVVVVVLWEYLSLLRRDGREDRSSHRNGQSEHSAVGGDGEELHNMNTCSLL